MDYLGCETSSSTVEPAVPVSTRPPKRARSPAAESETYKRPRGPISVAPKRINEALREEVSSSSIGSDPFLSNVVRDSEDWPVGVADPYDWTIQQLLYAVEADDLSAGVFGSVNDSKNIKDDVTVRAFIRECSIDGQLLLTCVNDLALRNRNIKLESTRRALAIAIVHLRKHSPRYSQHCLDERQLENFDPCQLINNDLIYGPLSFQQRLKDCIMIVLDDMIADTAVFSKPKCWYFEIGCISATKRNDKPFKFAYAVGHPLSADAFNLDSSQNVFRCQSAAPVPHSDPMRLAPGNTDLLANTESNGKTSCPSLEFTSQLSSPSSGLDIAIPGMSKAQSYRFRSSLLINLILDGCDSSATISSSHAWHDFTQEPLNLLLVAPLLGTGPTASGCHGFSGSTYPNDQESDPFEESASQQLIGSYTGGDPVASGCYGFLGSTYPNEQVSDPIEEPVSQQSMGPYADGHPMVSGYHGFTGSTYSNNNYGTSLDPHMGLCAGANPMVSGYDHFGEATHLDDQASDVWNEPWKPQSTPCLGALPVAGYDFISEPVPSNDPMSSSMEQPFDPWWDLRLVPAGSQGQAITSTDFPLPNSIKPPGYDGISASVVPNDPMSSLTEQPLNLQWDIPLRPDGSQVHKIKDTDLTFPDWSPNLGYNGIPAATLSNDPTANLLKQHFNLWWDRPLGHEIFNTDFTFPDPFQNLGHNNIWASAFCRDHMSDLFEQQSYPVLIPPFTDDDALTSNRLTTQELTSTALHDPFKPPEYDGFSTSPSPKGPTSESVEEQSYPQPNPPSTDNEPQTLSGSGPQEHTSTDIDDSFKIPDYDGSSEIPEYESFSVSTASTNRISTLFDPIPSQSHTTY